MDRARQSSHNPTPTFVDHLKAQLHFEAFSTAPARVRLLRELLRGFSEQNKDWRVQNLMSVCRQIDQHTVIPLNLQWESFKGRTQRVYVTTYGLDVMSVTKIYHKDRRQRHEMHWAKSLKRALAIGFMRSGITSLDHLVSEINDTYIKTMSQESLEKWPLLRGEDPSHDLARNFPIKLS